MSLMRYEPQNLLSDMSQLFDTMTRRFNGLDTTSLETSQWVPSIDLAEKKDKFIIHADLPGVDKKDIDIAVKNNVITIKGQRETVKKEERDDFYREERVKGNFCRRFALPDTANCDKLAAKSKAGVLEITIPKQKSKAIRKIEIK